MKIKGEKVKLYEKRKKRLLINKVFVLCTVLQLL